MQETDKDRILNFLVGNEPINEFEAWIYKTVDLDKRIGEELYFELIQINYKDQFILENLTKIVIGNYIPFDDFKYKLFLHNAGWYPNRKIEVDLTKEPDTPEIHNAFKIIEEFGGLKFVSPNRKENWSMTLVEIFEEPYTNIKMNKYGLNKKLVCFATGHNSHINLFVDADNKFYLLDNVVSEFLYKFNGSDFKDLMQQLLQSNYEDNFEKVGQLK